MDENVKQIIETLELSPHPEGGYYRETYRAEMTVTHPEVMLSESGTRSAGTAIYFLVPDGEISAFHRVRTDETWHLYQGGPLELHVIHPDGQYEMVLLTNNLREGHPQHTVAAHCWQAARCGPGVTYALGGCTVAPGFDFEDFEMPDAEPIVRQHPEHEAIIRELAKSNPSE